jgi:hypothetical protein
MKNKLLTKPQHDFILHTHSKKLVREVINLYIHATGLALRDELGFGKERITKVLKRINDIADSVNKDYISFKDIENTLKEEINLVIE